MTRQFHSHKPTSHTFRLAIVSLGLSALLLAPGCAEYVTYSNDARRKGIGLYEQQQYVDAAGSFQNAVKQNPRDYKSHYWLGQSYLSIGQVQQSIQSHKAAMDIRPTVPAGIMDNEYRELILDGYAAAVSKSTDLPTEIDLLEKQALLSTVPDPYLVKARVFRGRGDADSAIETYETALSKYPRNFEVNKEAGLYMAQLGLPAKARPLLQTARSLNLSDKQVQSALASLGG